MSRPAQLLLESFVLDCIGHLPPSRAIRAEAWAARLSFGHDDWRHATCDAFGLAQGCHAAIQRAWEDARRGARSRGVDLTPEAFAVLLVDENFAEAVALVNVDFEEP
ncbi:MAG: hypothetical protein ACFB9M_13245 [Myxococcota bacterium]